MKQTLPSIVLLSIFLAGCTASEPPEPAAVPGGTGQIPATTTPEPAAEVTPEPPTPSYTLRHVFKKGETQRFHTTIAVLVKTSGLELPMNIQNFSQMKTLDVLEDGSGRMTYSVRRVLYKVTGPMGRINYDSDEDDEPESPLWAQLKPEVDFHKGLTFTAVISPLGTVSEIEITDEVKAIMKRNPGTASADHNEFLSSMAQAFFMKYPEQPLKADDNWKIEDSGKVLGGQMTSTKNFTLKVNETTGAGPVETLQLSAIVEVDTDFPEGAPISMTYQPGTQESTVSAETGRLVKSVGKQVRSQDIKMLGVVNRTELSIVTTLVPDNSPVESSGAEKSKATTPDTKKASGKKPE